ncbi:TauD/TfdA family dioxygenase [Burkholderia gladioli]|uniref:TauD/TfdA family dioxygenase n=1 Tax=Burkholderia gladioli TaxID=28095 RepID=UPI00163F90B8|nr:TauD/TfdA family dioxygenase [Burkholderia gladioli]
MCEISYLKYTLTAEGKDDRLLIEEATALLSREFAFIPVEGNAWNPLEVRLNAARERTHGVGENPLHVDYLAHACPPRLIAFLCLRNDPKGGGATQLSSFKQAMREVTDREKALLLEKKFWYWSDPTGSAFGESLPMFSIISGEIGAGVVRFSSKMFEIDGNIKQEIVSKNESSRNLLASALKSLRLSLQKHRIDILLSRGDLILFDQRIFAHGRSALGPGQCDLPIEQRRLLMQAYLSHKLPS